MIRAPTTIDDSTRDEPPGELSLLVIESETTSTQPLPASGTITIGRGPEADVRVSDPLVSRQHARVHVRPGGAVEIEDLGSQNGTRLGNVALAPRRCVPIKLGEPAAIGTGGSMLLVRHLPGQGRLRRMQTHEYFDARLEEECARTRPPSCSPSCACTSRAA
jgi:pSer/pThr/pTyr-binding forkhead associated (FHA) protein